jgi:hypothetical protein
MIVGLGPAGEFFLSYGSILTILGSEPLTILLRIGIIENQGKKNI